MKKLVLATVFVAAMSTFGAVGASAQTTGPAAQGVENGMNSNARMMHRHMKRPMHRHMMHKRKMGM